MTKQITHIILPLTYGLILSSCADRLKSDGIDNNSKIQLINTKQGNSSMKVIMGKDKFQEVENYGEIFTIISNNLKITVIDKYQKTRRVYALENHKLWIKDGIIHCDGIVSIDYSDNGYFGITKLDDGRWAIHHNEVEFEDHDREDGVLQFYEFIITKDGSFK
jgi:hypothetical protein